MLAAELRKIWRPALLWSGSVAVASSLIFVSIYQSAAHWQYTNAVDGLDAIENATMGEVCASLRLPVGPECRSAHRQGLEDARGYVAETIATFQRGAAIQHPFGSLGAAAGLTSSIAGLVAIAAIAAAHVGGEWTTGTVYSVLVRDPRRRRFVIAKFLSVWFAGTGVVVTTWVGLALLGPLFRAFYDVPPPPRGFSMLGFAVPSFFKALLVLAAFAAIGTLAGVLARHPLGAIGLSGAILVVSVIVPALAMGQLTWSLPYLVTAWMGFERTDVLGYHVWIFVDGAGGDVWSGAMAGLTLYVVIAVSLAIFRMSAGDLRRE